MGKPIQRARMAELDALGEDEVFRLYVEHGSVPKMCLHLFEAKEGRPGTQAVYDWLHATPERWSRWQKVKEMRGELEVDLALQAAEEADKDNVQVQRLRVDTHKWRAGILNRDYRPGQSQVQVNVGVQVGVAWLEALKNVATIRAEVVDE